MRIKFRIWLASGIALVLAFSQIGCSVGQQLVSIDVTPGAVVFGSACLPGDTNCDGVTLKAIGTYSHPPATKDITTQVTWASDIPGVVTVNSSGALTAGAECGVANVTATDTKDTPHGSVITGRATVTVDGPSSENCPTAPL